jgi:hypothetical protein
VTSTEQQPTFPEQLAANAPHEFYGVKVMWIGEDGEVLVLGHPGKRRALAAANKLARVDAHLTNLFDDGGAEWDWNIVRELWATPAHTTGCKYVQAFLEWCNTEGPAPAGEVRPPVVEAGDRITAGQDCDCASKGDGEWYIRYDGGADEPGAFPVTEIDPGF